MRQTALKFAVAGFFALAIIGMCQGVSPLTCALRALAGAAVLFVLTLITVRVMLNVIVDSMMDSMTRRKK
jgi:predicted branched-subunit amino acid permease